MSKTVNQYSVFDLVSGEFGPLFQAKNNEVAKRSFGMIMRTVDPSARSGYSLFLVGEFDVENAEFISKVDEIGSYDEIFGSPNRPSPSFLTPDKEGE